MAGEKRILIVGIGNLLRQDDGVGCRCIEYLQTQPLPPEARLMDGGTGGLTVAQEMLDYDAVIVVDALQSGQAPGSVTRFEWGKDRLVAKDFCFDPHGWGVLAPLEMIAGDRKPPRVIVYGVEPEWTEYGMELSPAVENALPRVAEAVLQEVNRLPHEEEKE